MLATQRSGILKMRFAPGRGYMKLLVVSPDGAEVYDIKDVRLIRFHYFIVLLVSAYRFLVLGS
jgi:hypothetical protein